MARVTVEDCLKKVENRFDLVLVAAKRARELSLGSEEPILGWENDKPTVVALREIAAGLIDEKTVNEAEESEESFEDMVQEASQNLNEASRL